MVALEIVAPDTPDTVKEIPSSVAEGYTIFVLVEVYVFFTATSTTKLPPLAATELVLLCHPNVTATLSIELAC